MKTHLNRSITISAAFGIFASGLGASVAQAADTPSDSWSHKVIRMAWSGNGIAKDKRGVYNRAEVVWTGDGTTAGNVAFTCLAGKLAFATALGQVDLGEMITNPPDSKRRKLEPVDMWINGEQIPAENWVWMPAMETHKAYRRSSVIKMYKAALRGSKVELQSDGERVLLNLPKGDRTFKQFGQDCGVGLGAVKRK